MHHGRTICFVPCSFSRSLGAGRSQNEQKQKHKTSKPLPAASSQHDGVALSTAMANAAPSVIIRSRSGGVYSLSFVSAGKLLSGSLHGEVSLWDLRDQRPDASWKVSDETVLSVWALAQGQQCLSQSKDGRVGLWDVEVQKASWEVRTDSCAFARLAVMPGNGGDPWSAKASDCSFCSPLSEPHEIGVFDCREATAAMRCQLILSTPIPCSGPWHHCEPLSESLATSTGMCMDLCPAPALGRLFREPKLFACAVVSLTFHVALYGFGFWSCRPGGNMWNTIAAQESLHEGGAPEMQGTWLGLPLAMIHRPLEDLSNSTCGGTTNGQRPEPDWDTWVCYPREDIRAEESYTIWKQSLPALLVLMVLLGKITEENEFCSAVMSTWDAHSTTSLVTRGILMPRIAGMGAVCMGLSRALRNASPEVALATVWCFVLICMETVFRLLGAHTHAVPGWRHDQGFKSWCLLESLVCGDVLKQPVRNSSVCPISNAFILKGLAPWISFRFMALKLISLAFDDLWSYKELSSGVRSLESKPELIRRAETNLPREKYSWRYIVAYLGYAPLFFAGPILSYNAFVSQLEKKQETYRGRQVITYCFRLLLMMFGTEVFSVFWWYSQKLHGLTCSSDHRHENCIFDELSIWELYLGMHVRLHFTWLTLMILWRFGRFMSLADGVDCPENMLGCVTFFYTFEAFWRIWHASMNRFMLRYLYVPVGGKKRSWLAVPMVFGFVAYWHESTGFLTRPAWYAWGFLNAFGVTAEKALATTVGRQLAKGEADGNWFACILVFLGKGVGPIFLILVNVPAIFYENSWKFYVSFFNRGWETAVLLWTLVLTFSCTAVLVDAFREEDTTPRRAPLTSARSVPEELAELAPSQQKAASAFAEALPNSDRLGPHMLLATYESTACCLWDLRSPREPLFSCYAGDPQSPAICSAVLWRKAWVACAGGRISQVRLRADGHSSRCLHYSQEGDGVISICAVADIMHRWQRAVILCILGTSTADDDSWCTDVECVQDSGWQFVSACRKQLVRNVHYWRYTHESLALPALVAIGPHVKDVLVFGGADGGVVNLFLQSRDVQSVTWVSHLTQVTEVARRCMPSLVKLSDERLHRLTMNSDSGLMQVASGTKQFDIIVYDASSLQVEEKPLKKLYFQPAEIQKLRELLSSSGLLVASAGILRKPRSLQDAYSVLKRSFRKIWSLQHSAPDNSPEQGHSLAFVAGDGDISVPNQTWYGFQSFETCFYTPELHQALLAPSRTLSQILGLTMPPWPELVAANSPKESPVQKVSPASDKLCRYRSQKHFGRPLLDKTTPYQKLNVAEEPSSRCTALFLDEELQLTNVFGDFYHEALVHPAMAALGQLGRRVLVIGAGDGGVATALFRYPQVEKVIQVEIDEAVPEVAQEFLPEIAAGYQDPRHELVIMDGVRWVEENHVQMKDDSALPGRDGLAAARCQLLSPCIGRPAGLAKERIMYRELPTTSLEVARSVRAAPTPYRQPVEQPVYKDDKQGINAFAVRPDLRLVAAARWDRRVELFDAKTATSLGRLACHDGGVLCEVRMAELQFGAFSARLTRGLFPRQLQRYLGKKASKRLEPKDWKMEPPAVCREGAAGVLVKS
eukprot:s21_g16.t6